MPRGISCEERTGVGRLFGLVSKHVPLLFEGNKGLGHGKLLHDLTGIELRPQLQEGIRSDCYFTTS